MNAIERARTAYASPTAPVRTTQSLEYDAFAKVTSRLAASDPEGGYAEMLHALQDNRQLWLYVATHVADPANDLPQDLRARLFYLAEFTFATINKIILHKDSPAILVEVNTAVMRGLKAQETGR
ncbi:MAG: flagellar biosynthesis regulator FlaF [Qingshengfaniella sp.]